MARLLSFSAVPHQALKEYHFNIVAQLTLADRTALKQQAKAAFKNNPTKIFKAVEHLGLEEPDIIQSYEEHINESESRLKYWKGAYAEAVVSGACAQLQREFGSGHIRYSDSIKTTPVNDNDVDNTINANGDLMYIEVKNYDKKYPCSEKNSNIQELLDEFQRAQSHIQREYQTKNAVKERVLVITDCLTDCAKAWLKAQGWDVIIMGDQIVDLDYSRYLKAKKKVYDGLRRVMNI